MPSFDIVSEIDKQEIDNALNQARKELATRFDFKGNRRRDRARERQDHPDRGRRLAPARVARNRHREIVEAGVDLRNIDQQEPAISSIGHARQELKIQQGLEGDKAKEIIQAIKARASKCRTSCRIARFA